MVLQDGALAVAGGREIAPVINDLLSLPFALKIATKDFHPPDHISFASSHRPPNNRAFESSIDILNPNDSSQSHNIPLWPTHCVQGTRGSEIIPEIDVTKLDVVLEKGKDSSSEMFSGFADVFGANSAAATSMDLAKRLKTDRITHVFTVGLAGDFCVKFTALDAKKEGFEVCVIEDATRCVHTAEGGWEATIEELAKSEIQVVCVDGPEVQRVRAIS